MLAVTGLEVAFITAQNVKLPFVGSVILNYCMLREKISEKQPRWLVPKLSFKVCM
jgi:hypothetical protein